VGFGDLLIGSPRSLILRGKSTVSRHSVLRRIVDGMAEPDFSSIERRRRDRGWSAEELARRAGIAGRSVRNIELGRQRPHGGTLRLLAIALGCDPDDLTTNEAPAADGSPQNPAIRAPTMGLSSEHPGDVSLSVRLELTPDQLGALAQLVAERLSGVAPAPPEPDGFIDVAGAAEFLACPTSRVYSLVSARRIPFHKDGSRLLFDRAELRAYVHNGGARRP
jgi:excisionase family DNA binding protein